MHIYWSDVRSHSSAPESNKQNPRDRTLDLPFFFFCYKHIPSLKSLPSPAPNESLPNWFQGNFAALFVFNFCLREFLLSAFANRFELRCEPKRLMLLYYKICPCSADVFVKERGTQVAFPYKHTYDIRLPMFHLRFIIRSVSFGYQRGKIEIRDDS